MEILGYKFETGDWLTEEEVRDICRDETGSKFEQLRDKITTIKRQLAGKADKKNLQHEPEVLRQENAELKERVCKLEELAANLGQLKEVLTNAVNEQLGQECERLAENEKLATACRLLKEETNKAVASMQERIALMQEENQKLRAELEQHTTLSWWQHLVYGLIGPHK